MKQSQIITDPYTVNKYNYRKIKTKKLNNFKVQVTQSVKYIFGLLL